MAFEKGKISNPTGRPVGSENRTTKDVRESFRLLLENNLDNMKMWIEQVAATDPERAFVMMTNLAEYVIPKLARTELTGSDGQPLIPITKVEIIRTNAIEQGS